MASTKIINVSKSDDFDEVFELFSTTDAKDLILIFPKSPKIAKKASNFEAMKKEASNLGKTISIMTSDPNVISLASDAGIELLPASAKKTKKSPAKKKASRSKVAAEAPNDLPVVADIVSAKEEPVAVEEPTEVKEEVIAEIEPVEEVNESPISSLAFSGNQGDTLLADLAAAKNHEKVMKDILDMRNEQSVKIAKTREKAHEIDVKKKFDAQDNSEKIEKIWSTQDFIPSQVKMGKKGLLWAGVAVVLVAGAFAYGTLGSAQVTIKPQKQDVDFEIKAFSSVDQGTPDSTSNTIPGQQFASSKEEIGTFDLTETKEVVQKSSGMITIYNTSGTSHRLVATTRFQSEGGLIFRIPETIVVPPGTAAKPGSIQSMIYADRPGAEYNIPAGKFTVPGLKDSNLYSNFYANSTKAISGGFIGQSKIVTENDYTKAQESLTQKLRQGILDELKAKSGSFKVLDSVDVHIEIPETNVKVGEAADKLEMKVSGSGTVIGFREDDIKFLIQSYLNKSTKYELVEKNSTVMYDDVAIKNSGHDLGFTVKVKGESAAKIDSNQVLMDITGMSEEGIKTYFKNMKEVESAKITLSPFWVQKVPQNRSKISLKIEI